MENAATLQAQRESGKAALRFGGPIWTLILLAPFIAEVLGGSTRLSFLFVYLPEVMVWGVGALLCREMVRRWQAGATSLLLLGIGLSIAEEFVIQQTSLAPLPFPGSNASYGRLGGVNWVYFLFMLGFESVWVVVVPVQLTELAFSSSRGRPWLRIRGIVISCLVLVVGSFLAWYGWVKQALPRMHAAPYHPPLLTIALGGVSIVLLGMTAYAFRGVGGGAPKPGKVAMPPWLVLVTTFVFSAGWYCLLTLIFIPHPPVTAMEAIVAGVVWALAAYTIVRRFSSAAGWGDGHRWAAAVGAVLATMGVPYLAIGSWLRMDVIAIIVFDCSAIAGALLLGNRIRSRMLARTTEP